MTKKIVQKHHYWDKNQLYALNDHTVGSLIEKLNTYDKNALIKFDSYLDYDYHDSYEAGVDLSIIESRLESDEEYAERLAREEEARAKRKAAAERTKKAREEKKRKDDLAKLEQDKKEYERLKALFGDQ